jgi:hypothetical protein
MFNEMYSKGISIVALTEQNTATAIRSKAGQSITYPSGTSSNSINDFGIASSGLPHYFLLNAEREVVWYSQHVKAEEIAKLFNALNQ